MGFRRLQLPAILFLAFLMLLTLIPNRVSTVQANSSTADHLVISEIYYNAEDEYDSEFIELYNPTDKSIDLTNWDFRDEADASWINFANDTEKQNNLEIISNGFLLLVDGEWSKDKDNSDWPTGDVIDELSLSNSGGTVSIRDPDGTIVDEVTYAGDAENGQGVERKAYSDSTASSMRGSGSDAKKGNSYDTDDFAADFVEPLAGEPQNTASPTESSETEDEPPNQAPVAEAGGPYQCSIGQTIELDGSNSYDPDGTIVSYKWDYDQDGLYDDGSGKTPSFSCDNVGTITIDLKVEDNDGKTASDESSVAIETISTDFSLSVEDKNLPADGTSTTTLHIENGAPKGTIAIKSQFGNLSKDTITLDQTGSGSTILTAPSEPSTSIIIATGKDKKKGTTIYFKKSGTPDVDNSKATLIDSGNKQGTINAVNELQATVEATKKNQSAQETVALSVGTYSENPKEKPALSKENSVYFNLHTNKIAALSVITMKIYLDNWPEEPRVMYWNHPTQNWTSCNNYQTYPSEKSLELTINGNTKPAIDALSPLMISGGGLDVETIKIDKTGWNMLSIPLNPECNDPTRIFSSLEDSTTYRWDPTQNGGDGGYINTDGTYEKITPFQGVWVHMSEEDTPKSISIPGLYPGSARIDVPNKGWNQIGLPIDYKWSDLRIMKGKTGEEFSMEEAAEEDLLWEYVWVWDPEKEKYYAYGSNQEEITLQKGKGYWIKTKTHNLQVIVPYTEATGASSTYSSKTSIHPKSSTQKLPTPPLPPNTEPEESEPEPIATDVETLAYPNPATRKTGVTFETETKGVKKMRVLVMNTAGKLVYDSDFNSTKSYKWNLLNEEENLVPNGFYLYQVLVMGEKGKIKRGKIKKLLLTN